MAYDAYKNLAISTVATPPAPAASGTSLTVAAGEGARFPVPPFDVTIQPANALPTPANAEIARCTALTTDTLTLTRAQYGTTARTVLVGDLVFASFTKKFADDSLDAGNLTVGTLADARLSPNVPLLNRAGQVWTERQTYQHTTPSWFLVETDQPANQRIWEMLVETGLLEFMALDDSYATQVNALQLTRSGDAKVAQDLYEKGRTAPLGHWTDIPYSAGNFTGSPSGSWGVDSGDILTNAYTLIGKTLIVQVLFFSTSVSGSPTELHLALPSGLLARSTVVSTVAVSDNGAAFTPGYVSTTAGQGYLRFQRDPNSSLAWTNSVNATGIYGTAIVPLQ